MALTIYDMYSLNNNKFQLTLHAGKKGLHNPLTWVYLMEDIENADFLREKELIITTGMQLTGEPELFAFIEKLQLYNCCGLIINTGRYLYTENLSPRILQFCDEMNFPLFTMPWNIHISDVMQDFCLELSKQIQHEKILALSFEKALGTPQYEEAYLSGLIQEGYSLSGSYRVLTFELSDSDLKVEYLTTDFPDVYYLKYHQISTFILYGESAVTPDTFLTSFSKKLKSLKVSLRLGAGSQIISPNLLRESFLQALFCLSIAKNTAKSIVTFDTLGIYKLLYQISDTEFLKKFVDDCLGTILEYDKKHQADYLETLHIYLLHDCSIKETAEIMITHRNTINYRIRKARELLTLDFETPESKFQLMLAFYVREYLHFLEHLKD